jgi:hypothetical protein
MMLVRRCLAVLKDRLLRRHSDYLPRSNLVFCSQRDNAVSVTKTMIPGRVCIIQFCSVLIKWTAKYVYGLMSPLAKGLATVLVKQIQAKYKDTGFLYSKQVGSVNVSHDSSRQRLSFTTCLSLEMFKDSLAVSELLCHETSGGQHGETSVLKFLGLHDLEFLRVSRLQAKGIKAKVTRGVVGTEETGLVNRNILGVNPSDRSTLLLGSADCDGEKDPERGRDLSEVRDGRSGDLGIKEEGRTLNLFAHKETNGGEHGHTSVGQFSLTVTLEGVGIGLGRESKRVEESHGGKGTWEVVCL